MAGKRKSTQHQNTQTEGSFEPEELVADSGYVTEALSGKGGNDADRPASWGTRVRNKPMREPSVLDMSDEQLLAEAERAERLAERRGSGGRGY